MTLRYEMAQKVVDARFDALIGQIREGRTTFDVRGLAQWRVTAEADALPREVALQVGRLPDGVRHVTWDVYEGDTAARSQVTHTVTRIGVSHVQDDEWLRHVPMLELATGWMIRSVQDKLVEHMQDRDMLPVRGIAKQTTVEILPTWRSV